MGEYGATIWKHSHGQGGGDGYCLTPWSFECTYLHDTKADFGYYLCKESDHDTWEAALSAAREHLQGHTTEPITDDVPGYTSPCPWPPVVGR